LLTLATTARDDWARAMAALSALTDPKLFRLRTSAGAVRVLASEPLQRIREEGIAQQVMVVAVENVIFTSIG
jgi:hypothetical protein